MGTYNIGMMGSLTLLLQQRLRVNTYQHLHPHNHSRKWLESNVLLVTIMENDSTPRKRPFMVHAIEQLPDALKVNKEIREKTGMGTLNNLAVGAAIGAQAVELAGGQADHLKDVLLANRSIMMLDEAIEQSNKLGIDRVVHIIDEVKRWWDHYPEMGAAIDRVAACMKNELDMENQYRNTGKLPSMKDYLDTVVPSNGIELLALGYVQGHDQLLYSSTERFKNAVWNANLEVRIHADWMKHSKDSRSDQLDVYIIAQNEYPGLNRLQVQEKMRAFRRQTNFDDGKEKSLLITL